MNYRHLFGPVSSRRLGVSLGVDCVAPKTCNLDCIYCECGATTNLTMEQGEYVSGQELIGELTAYLKDKPALDYITFGGSGEPTLNSAIGKVVRFLKQEFPAYKTALLTNGTLLHLAAVREAVMPFDCVLPSLDAVSPETFRMINRHHPELDAARIIEGIAEFSRQYRGLLWLEIFIVPSVNDTPGELSRFREALTKIKPARVQLNSLDRPGACRNVPAASPQRLREIADFFLPLPVEIVSRGGVAAGAGPAAGDAEERLVAAAARRPLTIEEAAAIAGCTISDAEALVKRLEREGRLSVKGEKGEWICGKSAS